MLRIHFTAEDLARTRLPADPHPTWELVLSLHVLQQRHPPPQYRHWHRTAHEAARTRQLQSHLRLLTVLVPPVGSFPDFLTPHGAEPFEAMLDEVLATPRRHLRQDFAKVFAHRSPPGWVSALADGDRDVRNALRTALIRYNDEMVRPHLPHIAGRVRGERELRVRALCEGGVEALLLGLPSWLRWESPVLHADYPGPDRDLHLAGRGLTLVPSYFCHTKPVSFMDPELPPVLVYPVADSVLPDTLGGVPETPGAGLQSLVGHTRVQVLRELHTMRSTTELAERVGFSAGASSKHASALRSAGLVLSVRDGNTVRHVLTEAGRRLLAITATR